MSPNISLFDPTVHYQCSLTLYDQIFFGKPLKNHYSTTSLFPGDLLKFWDHSSCKLLHNKLPHNEDIKHQPFYDAHRFRGSGNGRRHSQRVLMLFHIVWDFSWGDSDSWIWLNGWILNPPGGLKINIPGTRARLTSVLTLTERVSRNYKCHFSVFRTSSQHGDLTAVELLMR